MDPTRAGSTGSGGSSSSSRSSIVDRSSYDIKELNVATFRLPEYLGIIRDSWNSPKRTTNYERLTTVIHIQDAHANYAAQHKIADIVEYLNKEFGISSVNLEGGAGNYNLSIFTGIADRYIRERVADYFVRQGLVSGAEYFASNNPDKVTLHGLEDPKLYMDNLDVYRDSLKNKDEIDRGLKNINLIFSSLKPKIYSPALLEFDMKYTSYKAGNLEFKEYLSYLISKARERVIDLSGFKNLVLLNQSLDLEKTIDFKKANIEREKLIDILQKGLSQRELEELVAKTVEYKAEEISQKDFYAYLVKRAKSVGEDLAGYPEFQKFIVYVSTYEAVDKPGVMSEIAAVEDKLKASLYENDVQKTLSALSKDLALLKNIFNISITRNDYEYYIRHKSAFDMKNYVAFIDKYAPQYKITVKLNGDVSNLDRYRVDLEKFYSYSFKRDDVFVKNIRSADSVERIAYSEREKIDNLSANRYPLNANRTAIVITGGFHTENLCELFKKEGVSYISIMPNYKNAAGYECPYFALLAGKPPCQAMNNLKSIMVNTLAISSILSEMPLDEIYGNNSQTFFYLLAKWQEAANQAKPEGIMVEVANGKYRGIYPNGELVDHDLSAGSKGFVTITKADLRQAATVFNAKMSDITATITNNPTKGIINDPGFIERFNDMKKVEPGMFTAAVTIGIRNNLKRMYGMLSDEIKSGMTEEAFINWVNTHKTVVIFSRDEIEKEIPDSAARGRFAEMVLFHENVHRMIIELDQASRERLTNLLFRNSDYVKAIDAVINEAVPSLDQFMAEFIANRFSSKSYPDVGDEEERAFGEKIEELANDPRGGDFWAEVDRLGIYEGAAKRTTSIIVGLAGKTVPQIGLSNAAAPAVGIAAPFAPVTFKITPSLKNISLKYRGIIFASVLSKVAFGLIILVSFMNPSYSPLIHIIGTIAALPFIGSGLLDARKLFSETRVGGFGLIIRLLVTIIFLVADIVYGAQMREIPHDARVVVTATVHTLDSINGWAGGRTGPPVIMSSNADTDMRAGFYYGEHDIVSDGFFKYTSKLHYVKVDPRTLNVVVRAGESTADLTRTNNALAGINGGYISKNLTPLGLTIIDGEEVFPYTSSNIEIELVSGEILHVPAIDYKEKRGPFTDLQSIKRAKQYAPNGLVIKDGKIVRDINPNYLHPILGNEAIFVVFDDGSAHVFPAFHYEERKKPFDGSTKIRQAVQTGPLTYFHGKRIERTLVTTEATRGKVAYAIDTRGNLYLMTTDSLRGVYGMTFTEFTESLLAFGRSQGIAFDSIAFGDAGGAGTLTVRDETTGQYIITGAAVKSVSGSAILVLPHEPLSAIQVKEVDWSSISFSDAIPVTVTDRQALKQLVEEHPSLIVDWWRNGADIERGQLMSIMTTYLASFEDANMYVGDIFVKIAQDDLRQGLLFLQLLGPANLSRVFINYSTGDLINDPREIKGEYVDTICRILANEPESAARLLIDVSLLDLSRSFPRKLSRLPPNKFNSMNSGLWISYAIRKIDQMAAADIINRVIDSPDGEIVKAQFFEETLLAAGSEDGRKWIEYLIDINGQDWLAKNLAETIKIWLPDFEEYYHDMAFPLTNSVNNFPQKVKDEVVKALTDKGIVWSEIETVSDKRYFSGDIEDDCTLVKRCYVNKGLFSDKPDENSAAALQRITAKLEDGALNNEPEALYMLAILDLTKVNVPKTRRLACEKLKDALINSITNPIVTDRITDLALDSDDPQIRDTASRALIDCFNKSPDVLARNIRAIVWLASQDMDVTASRHVLKELREQSSIAELMMRLVMSETRHALISPTARYRDILSEIFKPVPEQITPPAAYGQTIHGAAGMSRDAGLGMLEGIMGMAGLGALGVLAWSMYLRYPQVFLAAIPWLGVSAGALVIIVAVYFGYRILTNRSLYRKKISLVLPSPPAGQAPGTPIGRGVSNRPNAEYTPFIEGMISEGQAAVDQGRLTTVALGTEGFEASQLQIDGGGVIDTPALDPAKQKKLNDALDILKRDYPGDIGLLQGAKILFMQGLDNSIRERLPETERGPPESCYGTHYGLERNQYYLDTSRLDNPKELARQLHHEIQERAAVIKGLEEKGITKILPAEKRTPEVRDLIDKLSSDAHARIVDEETFLNMVEGLNKARQEKEFEKFGVDIAEDITNERTRLHDDPFFMRLLFRPRSEWSRFVHSVLGLGFGPGFGDMLAARFTREIDPDGTKGIKVTAYKATYEDAVQDPRATFFSKLLGRKQFRLVAEDATGRKVHEFIVNLGEIRAAGYTDEEILQIRQAKELFGANDLRKRNIVRYKVSRGFYDRDISDIVKEFGSIKEFLATVAGEGRAVKTSAEGDILIDMPKVNGRVLVVNRNDIPVLYTLYKLMNKGEPLGSIRAVPSNAEIIKQAKDRLAGKKDRTAAEDALLKQLGGLESSPNGRVYHNPYFFSRSIMNPFSVSRNPDKGTARVADILESGYLRGAREETLKQHVWNSFKSIFGGKSFIVTSIAIISTSIITGVMPLSSVMQFAFSIGIPEPIFSFIPHIVYIAFAVTVPLAGIDFLFSNSLYTRFSEDEGCFLGIGVWGDTKSVAYDNPIVQWMRGNWILSGTGTHAGAFIYEFANPGLSQAGPQYLTKNPFRFKEGSSLVENRLKRIIVNSDGTQNWMERMRGMYQEGLVSNLDTILDEMRKESSFFTRTFFPGVIRRAFEERKRIARLLAFDYPEVEVITQSQFEAERDILHEARQDLMKERIEAQLAPPGSEIRKSLMPVWQERETGVSAFGVGDIYGTKAALTAAPPAQALKETYTPDIARITLESFRRRQEQTIKEIEKIAANKGYLYHGGTALISIIAGKFNDFNNGFPLQDEDNASYTLRAFREIYEKRNFDQHGDLGRFVGLDLASTRPYIGSYTGALSRRMLIDMAVKLGIDKALAEEAVRTPAVYRIPAEEVLKLYKEGKLHILSSAGIAIRGAISPTAVEMVTMPLDFDHASRERMAIEESQWSPIIKSALVPNTGIGPDVLMTESGPIEMMDAASFIKSGAADEKEVLRMLKEVYLSANNLPASDPDLERELGLFADDIRQNKMVLAISDGEIVGFLKFNPTNNKVVLLEISSDYKRQGIGSALMDRVIAKLSELNRGRGYELRISATSASKPFYVDYFTGHSRLPEPSWQAEDYNPSGNLFAVKITPAPAPALAAASAPGKMAEQILKIASSIEWSNPSEITEQGVDNDYMIAFNQNYEIFEKSTYRRELNIDAYDVHEIYMGSILLVNTTKKPNAVVLTRALDSCTGVGIIAVAPNGDIYRGLAHLAPGPDMADNFTRYLTVDEQEKRLHGYIKYIDRMLKDRGFKAEGIEYYINYNAKTSGIDMSDKNPNKSDDQAALERRIAEDVPNSSVSFYRRTRGFENTDTHPSTVLGDNMVIGAFGIFIVPNKNNQALPFDVTSLTPAAVPSPGAATQSISPAADRYIYESIRGFTGHAIANIVARFVGAFAEEGIFTFTIVAGGITLAAGIGAAGISALVVASAISFALAHYFKYSGEMSFGQYLLSGFFLQHLAFGLATGSLNALGLSHGAGAVTMLMALAAGHALYNLAIDYGWMWSGAVLQAVGLGSGAMKLISVPRVSEARIKALEERFDADGGKWRKELEAAAAKVSHQRIDIEDLGETVWLKMIEDDLGEKAGACYRFMSSSGEWIAVFNTNPVYYKGSKDRKEEMALKANLKEEARYYSAAAIALGKVLPRTKDPGTLLNDADSLASILTRRWAEKDRDNRLSPVTGLTWYHHQILRNVQSEMDLVRLATEYRMGFRKGYREILRFAIDTIYPGIKREYRDEELEAAATYEELVFNEIGRILRERGLERDVEMAGEPAKERAVATPVANAFIREFSTGEALKKRFEGDLRQYRSRRDGLVIYGKISPEDLLSAENGIYYPAYGIKTASGDMIYLSSPFKQDDGRQSFVAFVVTEDSKDGVTRMFVQGYYKSNSQDDFRVASHTSPRGWIGKGLSEYEESLPVEVQETMESIIAASGGLKEGRGGWRGVLEVSYGQLPQQDQLISQVEPRMRALSPIGRLVNAVQNRFRSAKDKRREGMKIIDIPETNDFKYYPDFENGLLRKYTSESDIYGTVTNFVVRSYAMGDDELEYIFKVAEVNGKKVAFLQTVQSRGVTGITRQGVKENNHKIVVPDSWRTPAFEYAKMLEMGLEQRARREKGPYPEIDRKYWGEKHPSHPQYRDVSPYLDNEVKLIKDFKRAFGIPIQAMPAEERPAPVRPAREARQPSREPVRPSTSQAGPAIRRAGLGESDIKNIAYTLYAVGARPGSMAYKSHSFSDDIILANALIRSIMRRYDNKEYERYYELINRELAELARTSDIPKPGDTDARGIFGLLRGIEERMGPFSSSDVEYVVEVMTRPPDEQDNAVMYSTQNLIIKEMVRDRPNDRAVAILKELWTIMEGRTLGKLNAMATRSYGGMPNRSKYEEDLVSGVQEGNMIAGYLKIHNFKDEFNTRGEKLGIGHYMGNAGLLVAGQALSAALERELRDTGIECSVYTQGPEFFMIFRNVKAGDDVIIEKAVRSVIAQDSDFKNEVVEKTKEALGGLLVDQPGKYKELRDMWEREAAEKAEGRDVFNAGAVNLYGGFSIALTGAVSADEAVEKAEELTEQASKAGKYVQLRFGKGIPHKEAKETGNFERLKKEITALRENGVAVYSDEIGAQVVEDDLGLRNEYAGIHRPISETYNPDNTWDKLFKKYSDAIKRGDYSAVSSARSEIIRRMVSHSSEAIDDSGRIIFNGNMYFKFFIDYFSRENPREPYYGAFKIGGDEMGSSVWNGRSLKIFRFDGNNIGAITTQYGLEIGNRVIDESLVAINKAMEAMSQGRLELKDMAGFIEDHFKNADITDEFIRSGRDVKDYMRRIGAKTSIKPGRIMLSELIVDANYSVLQDVNMHMDEESRKAGRKITRKIMVLDDKMDPHEVDVEYDKGGVVFRFGEEFGEREMAVNDLGAVSPRGPPIRLKVTGLDGYNLRLEGDILSDGLVRDYETKVRPRLREDFTVPVHVPPSLSTGMVEIDGAQLSKLAGNYEISMVQGRADTKADEAKRRIKEFQILNGPGMPYAEAVQAASGVDLAHLPAHKVSGVEELVVKQILQMSRERPAPKAPKAGVKPAIEKIAQTAKEALPETKAPGGDAGVTRRQFLGAALGAGMAAAGLAGAEPRPAAEPKQKIMQLNLPLKESAQRAEKIKEFLVELDGFFKGVCTTKNIDVRFNAVVRAAYAVDAEFGKAAEKALYALKADAPRIKELKGRPFASALEAMNKILISEGFYLFTELSYINDVLETNMYAYSGRMAYETALKGQSYGIFIGELVMGMPNLEALGRTTPTPGLTLVDRTAIRARAKKYYSEVMLSEPPGKADDTQLALINLLKGQLIDRQTGKPIDVNALEDLLIRYVSLHEFCHSLSSVLFGAFFEDKVDGELFAFLTVLQHMDRDVSYFTIYQLSRFLVSQGDKDWDYVFTPVVKILLEKLLDQLSNGKRSKEFTGTDWYTDRVKLKDAFEILRKNTNKLQQALKDVRAVYFGSRINIAAIDNNMKDLNDSLAGRKSVAREDFVKSAIGLIVAGTARSVVSSPQTQTSIPMEIRFGIITDINMPGLIVHGLEEGANEPEMAREQRLMYILKNGLKSWNDIPPAYRVNKPSHTALKKDVVSLSMLGRSRGYRGTSVWSDYGPGTGDKNPFKVAFILNPQYVRANAGRFTAVGEFFQRDGPFFENYSEGSGDILNGIKFSGDALSEAGASPLSSGKPYFDEVWTKGVPPEAISALIVSSEYAETVKRFIETGMPDRSIRIFNPEGKLLFDIKGRPRAVVTRTEIADRARMADETRALMEERHGIQGIKNGLKVRVIVVNNDKARLNKRNLPGVAMGKTDYNGSSAKIEGKVTLGRHSRVFYVDSVQAALDMLGKPGEWDDTFVLVEDILAEEAIAQGTKYDDLTKQAFVQKIHVDDGSLCRLTPLGSLIYGIKFHDILARIQNGRSGGVQTLTLDNEDFKKELESFARIILINKGLDITEENIKAEIESLSPLLKDLLSATGDLKNVLMEWSRSDRLDVWYLAPIKPQDWGEVSEYFEALEKVYTAA